MAEMEGDGDDVQRNHPTEVMVKAGVDRLVAWMMDPLNRDRPVSSVVWEIYDVMDWHRARDERDKVKRRKGTERGC